jgi:hypothetical protein
MAPITGRKKNRKKECNKANFKKPKIMWKQQSDAKWLLYKDIMEGLAPLKAADNNGKSMMSLHSIYTMGTEYSHYLYEEFFLPMFAEEDDQAREHRAKDDEEGAFKSYKQNQLPSAFSQRGYIQRQGSKAQKLLEEDMEVGVHKLPLSVFRDKIYQEIRTAKYLYTCQVKEKLHKSSYITNIRFCSHFI